MISVEEALRRITGAFRPLAPETVSLADALGRVLAEQVTARIDQPPKAVSAMDGYAVRAKDLRQVPTTLAVIGSAPAGGAYDGCVGAGQAVRIFTGGPLPDGADSIVIQEDTEAGNGKVTVKETPRQGQFVRPAGLDFRAGDIGIAAGKRLTARDIGLAAAMNHPWLKVHRRPRVAIVATGDEVVLPGDPLGPNQIISSNGFSLSALIRASGGLPIHLGIAPDRQEALQEIAAGAQGADLLITSGGASVGDHDLVQQALGDKGLELDFWRIAMRPGKPLMFGRMGATPILGVPGNPVSALVCGLLFAVPAIQVMQGLPGGGPERIVARLGGPLPANDRRQDYLRARLDTDAHGHRIATAFERQDSSMLATLAHAEGLIERPAHAPAAAAGDSVTLLTFRQDMDAF